MEEGNVKGCGTSPNPTIPKQHIRPPPQKPVCKDSTMGADEDATVKKDYRGVYVYGRATEAQVAKVDELRKEGWKAVAITVIMEKDNDIIAVNQDGKY